MPSDILVVAALGRPFTLGMLYDARNDKLIPGFTLWEDEVIEESTLESSQPSSAFEIIASDSTDDKSSLMDIEASLKASFLGGLVEVGGSAKYLNNQKKFKNQSRVTLQYKATTSFKQLMTNLGTKHVEYSELFENIQATHVVIGILYGANAFFVFDSNKVDSTNVQEIQGQMEAVIKKIPSVEISGKASVQLTGEETDITNSFSCEFHGDFFLTTNPTTFEDAVKTYQQLPQMMGKDNAVPMTVWLVPMVNFYSEAPQLMADSSTPILRKVRNTLEAIVQVQMRCNDALDDPTVNLFTEVQKKLSDFQKICDDHMSKLQATIAKKLFAIRSGDEDESALLNLFEENLQSPFNIESLNMWMEFEEREINVLRSCMDILTKAKPKVIFNQGVLFKGLYDSKVKHALCYVFTNVTKNDVFLNVLNEFLDSPQSRPKKLRPSPKDYWYSYDDIPETMREKAYLFRNLAKEMNNRCVHFFVTAIHNPKQEGAGIHYYRESIQIIDEFTKPYMPGVESIKDRRELQWYDCELTLDPETAHQVLTLSEGNKKAVSGNTKSPTDHLEKFSHFQQVMCTKGLSGRHYWELEWSGYVGAGVTYKGIGRKTSTSDSSLGKNEKSWLFEYSTKSGYQQIHNSKKTRVTVSSTGFKLLGVYLDWPAGTLSFYMVNKAWVTHLHTFHTKFNEAVYPAFLIGDAQQKVNGQIKLL
uniref:Stonustoxin subunit beta n=1 Tax=Synanceia horrida TaxID=13279 RepID=STXB_SYNHO|nr:RecName: Full=Stonustoxin subunit beta; Short=SNTX subunit beta; AltName: Full=DELTA-synanceitoxin-Sh1b; Short=DELTA-SYTX-Sh1b; AltName: Full=Trachynilysin subunit beta; Short=TLY subunit beta [Synanceia horrida]AAC60021.1 stonustoxin beta-subunit [Synanceia horrida]4WVM_B Chain B, Stonustoxin subunit beta [Synanceia horrida]